MDFTALVEAFLRRVEERRLQRLAAELWKFAEALDVWLHHLFAHPNTDWPEQLNTFLAWQEAEGRRAMPESRQSLVDYLTWWSTSIGLEPASAPRAPVAATPESSSETSAMTPDEETEAEHSAGGYPEAFGPAIGMLEEEMRSRSALAMPPLVSEPPPVPDRTPRIVKIEEIQGFWDDYRDLLASGQYEQGWWESISYSFASVVLPSSERSIKFTFDDGTVLILLGGGPDSDALAGQATVILGAHGAVVGSGTLWQAVVAALKHLGRETAETVADNVVQEVTGLPVGPSSLLPKKGPKKGKSRTPQPSHVRAPRFWTSTVTFKGLKVYQRNDLIDPKRLDARGITNLGRMKNGQPPIGPDGKRLNLHHLLQTNDGPIAEVTTTVHQQWTRIIHTNPNNIPSGIDRPEFDSWRREYWANRAFDFAEASL